MTHPTPLIHSSIPVDPVRLEKLVNYIKARTTYEREQLGWQQSRAFTADSLFDKWAKFEAQAEQDFEKRRTKGSIYEDSNLSQNLPYSIGSQHQDKITRDLLSSPKFFDVNPGKRRRGVSPYRSWMRFSFGPPLDNLAMGLERLEKMVRGR